MLKAVCKHNTPIGTWNPYDQTKIHWKKNMQRSTTKKKFNKISWRILN